MKTILKATLILSLLAASNATAAEETATAEPAVAAEPAAAEPAKAEPVADEAKPPSAEEPKAEPAKAEAAPAATPAAPATAAQVVEGAPLGNSNVYVHIIEKKPYTNAGRHEVVLYPAVAQVNSKFTTHVGAAAMYSYHLFENLALQVTPLFNYVNHESAFNQELIDKGHQQAQAATALLLQYGAVAGMEVTPMYGKFAFYQGSLGHFTFVLNAGAGMGSTRIQLRPDQKTNCGPGTDTPECRVASFGGTGSKFLGSVGAGLRVYLGERAAVRLEVRDLVYTARVDKINGCTYEDLTNVGNGLAAINASCDARTTANGGRWDSDDDKQLAKLLLKDTSSDVLNNISVYAGFSFLF